MKSLAAASLFALVFLGAPAHSADFQSAYSDIGDNCTIVAAAEQGNGDWVDRVCDGYRGYPVAIHSADLRESIFYGYPPASDAALVWESFSAFNRTGPRIEWRLEMRGDNPVPFATIHRWFVSDGDRTTETEVLVVEKVGQPGAAEGCVVGYVVATGNSRANDKARDIADARASDFACGTDQPAIDAGSIALPEPVSGR